MVTCFLAVQDMSEEPKKKQKLVVDLLESTQPVQSAST